MISSFAAAHWFHSSESAAAEIWRKIGNELYLNEHGLWCGNISAFMSYESTLPKSSSYHRQMLNQYILAIMFVLQISM